jgi:beta-fructofuranosidase
MWECPDLFTLGADTFLICCPQGVAREARRFLNTHPSAYLSGTFSPEQATFEHGALHELDAGFEFYAPQTTLSADGGACWWAGWACRMGRDAPADGSAGLDPSNDLRA